MSNRHFDPILHIPHYSGLLFRALRTPLLMFFVVAGNLLMLTGAALFTFLEQGHNDKVQGYADGLWWAMTTVTTVGYGDITPVTMGGRLVAAVLMVAGISSFVSFAAVLVSSIDGLAAEEISAQSAQQTTDIVIREVHNEMKQLRLELAAMRAELLSRLPPK